MTIAARRVAASSAILLAENIVRLATVAAISFWIARVLGPAQFGILNFASALMAILLSVAEMGMEVPVVLRLTRTERPGAVMGTVLMIRCIVSGVVYGLAALLAVVMKEGDRDAQSVTIIVSVSILFYIAHALDFWFKARTSAGPPALARTLGTLLAAAVKAVCLTLGLGLIALAWTIVLEAAFVALGIWHAFLRSAAGSVRDALSTDPQLLRPLMRESMPYFFSSVAVLIYMKIDVVMLGYLSTNTQTGIYSLAQKLSEVIYVVPVILVTSAHPSMAKRYLESEADNQHLTQMLFDLAVGASIAVVVAANLLASPVIEGLFGHAYRPSVEIFYLHSWSCIAIAMNEARHRWLATLSLQRFAPTVTAIGLVMNLGMNVLLIPPFGATGAAITTIVSYFVSGYLSSFIIKPLRMIGVAQTRALWPWGRLYRAACLWQKGELLA